MLYAITILLFTAIIVSDFIIEVSREEVRPLRAIIRGFMVLACAYLL